MHGCLEGQFYKFHAAVGGAAVFGGVGGHRGERADPAGFKPVCGNAVFGDQVIGDGFGAFLGKLHIMLKAAGGIGMTDDSGSEIRVVFKQGSDLCEGVFGLGLYRGLIRVEVDAVEADLAGFFQVFCHGGGVEIDANQA